MKRVPGSELSAFFSRIHERFGADEVTFVCIGTDRSTGDALGPLTGTLLKEKGFPHVIGTLAAPCDAVTLEAEIGRIPAERQVIAIDACLGQPGSMGLFLVSEAPLAPARSMGIQLPPIGHYSVAGVVNLMGPKPYWTLQTTSLHQVMIMAADIADGAVAGFGLS
ncbi:spore protease YyaC [Paenibacillus sp. P96]|uniref:Spore protease YyaC n=1 Tax=Paenibacillus zeirhizosphaerae TaxID=2987519 RepID=A0ABT9FTN6_9BACL|nr:spore protease YyaC [Paenibacillus sp. P96]MDP4098083.1 spore protease YyaC [Paenibacillus sp. P96]